MYPHQSIASFHPTSKDSLCGAHSKRIGSMHLFHIYCKNKNWIHGDDIAHNLINTVHVFGEWMMKMRDSFYETLFLIFILFILYLEDLRTWLSLFFFNFFIMPF